MYYIRASASQEVVRVMLSSVQRVKTNFDKKKETNLVVEEMIALELHLKQVAWKTWLNY